MLMPSPFLIRIVWFLRFAVPASMIFSLTAAYFAWRSIHPLLASTDTFCAGADLVLTWVQWCIFQTKET